MRYYPAFLDLRDQRCVVLGGNRLAAEKAAGLLEAGAAVTVIAASRSLEMEQALRDSPATMVERDYRSGDLAGARLLIDASGDLAINAASWAEAEAGGVLANVVDVVDKCRFIAPAIVRRDPLLVAISTSGESPFLASALRVRIERILGEEWGPFTALVGSIRRRLRAEKVSLEDQVRTYRRLLGSEILGLLRRGETEAALLAAGEIADEARESQQGRVALVGAGPGDPKLITVAGQELLWQADVVLHDALVHPATLKLAGPAAELVDVGKRSGRSSPSQRSITRRLIEEARSGRNVVRLKGGDPFIFGRGGEELSELVAAGIEVVVVPGVSSAIAGPAAAGIPLTLRNVAASVGIISGHAAGSELDLERISRLAAAVDTLVVLMPLAGLPELTGALATVLPADRAAAVISQATSPEQVTVRGTIADIAEATSAAGVEAPALLVVGDVVETLPKQRLSSLLAQVTAS